jgi:RNA polymerase sigma-70 factor, ECF subfamily
MNSPDEQGLINGARAFSPLILTAIYKLYSPGIYRYAVRLLGDERLAEDCVIDTFACFFKALRAGQGPQDHLQVYLYQIAHNWITERYCRQTLPLLDLDDSLPAANQSFPTIQIDTGMEDLNTRLPAGDLLPKIVSS